MTNIRDIALQAGVSVATVSRSLSQPSVVRPQTLKKVKAAIDLLDYRPNGLASSLRRARSHNVVVVVPDINNPFFAGVVQGIEGTARDAGYRLLLGETRDDPERVDDYLEMLMTKAADGLILLAAQLPRNMPKAGTPLPLVMACEYIPGLKAPVVRIDNAAAAALAGRHLTGLGHRRIAHISGPGTNILSQERLRGFRAALAEAGISLPRRSIVCGDFSIESGHRAMLELLAQPQRPTAVFCGSDEMAIGAMHAVAGKGLQVPADISIMGFDDSRYARFAATPLTTIAQPHEEIGRNAMQILLELMERKLAISADRILPHSLVIRQSTAAAPRP